jgi:hypothetical protein
VAVNVSRTLQFVWQTQLGCVAFCFDTVQNQTASQTASTTQTATALAALMATALNVGETAQYVWQYQKSCQVECHNVSASQSLSQQQRTDQTATAVGEPAYEEFDRVVGRPTGAVRRVAAGAAQNLGATLQVIFQHQVASCLNHCSGGAQTQDAAQRARTTQEANTPAKAEEPPPSTEEPVTGGAPAAE